MAVFGSPFSGLVNDRKLMDTKLIWEMSFLLAAEFEATELHHHPAESPCNMPAVVELNNLADEERVHAGEFLRLLHELDPDEKKLYAEGSEQVEIAIRKMK